MPESGLAVTYSTLRSELGYTLGYGRTSSAWTSDQTSEISSCLDTMLRRVYYHASSAATAGTPHRWSFLRPVEVLHTVNGSQDLPLPEWVGEIVPPITFGPTHDYCPITVVDDSVIRIRSQANTTNGWPRLVSLVTDKADGSMPTRMRFRFWPIPDDEYAIEFKHELKIDQLSSSRPYPPGGVKMSEVLLSAVRAAKELLIDDAPGAHTADLAKLLNDAVRSDQQASTPARLGVIHNPGMRYAEKRNDLLEVPTVTFS